MTSPTARALEGSSTLGRTDTVREDEQRVSAYGLLLISYGFFLTLNPYLALFLMSMLTLFVKAPSKAHLLFVGVSLATFYASREIGVTWATGADDVTHYVQLFLDDQQNGLTAIFARFASSPNNNEVLYFGSQWVVGKIVGADRSTYVFMTYAAQLALLCTIAWKVSKPYALVFVFLFFFGIGDPHPSLLHLWRANIGMLVFLLGVVIFSEGRTRAGRVIMFAAMGFHISLVAFIAIFELYHALRKTSGFFVTVGLGALIVYLSANVIVIVIESTLPGIIISYFVGSESFTRNATQMLVVIILLVANYVWDLSPASRFLTFMFAIHLVLQIVFNQYPPLITRLGQVAVPMIAVPIFEILSKQSRYVVAVALFALFLRGANRPPEEMYSRMLPAYKAPGHSMLRILF